jgi:hypothetical protein
LIFLVSIEDFCGRKFSKPLRRNAKFESVNYISYIREKMLVCGWVIKKIISCTSTRNVHVDASDNGESLERIMECDR